MAASQGAFYPSSVGYSAQVAPISAATTFPTTYEELPDGAAGTFRSLEAMAQATRGEIPPDFSGYTDPAIQIAAESLTVNSHGLDESEASALFDFVAHSIKYIDHPPNAQVVQDALRTIQIGSGDCVSKSVLLATLLLARGIPARFVAQYPDDSQMYSHVYVEAQMSGHWFPLDPVASDKPMGWSQPLPDGGFETMYEIF